MLTIAYYFAQVILCSCLLMGYYLLVLRNKRFHQYNRFYLLAVAVLSWTVPLIKIRWTHPVINQDPQVFQLLSVVADNNSQIENNIITKQGFQWSGYTIAAGIYFLVATILLTGMLLAFYRIYRLLKQHSCKNVEDVYLILTKANGTPFSFFRYIFWNEEIDLRSESGKQILQHEITHVRQKHSFDKIFIRLMLIPGWFNPFFWLLKREMEMIHEFIADKKAVNNGDTASLAQMLLTAAYPQQQFALTNPFFFSPIRRRLKMLTNNTNPRFSYMRRTIVLPLLAIVVILFSFRTKEKRENEVFSVELVMQKVISAVTSKVAGSPKGVIVSDIAMLDKMYTVVIDAGHGGSDKGMVAADGTPESLLTLQLAKKIKELNDNGHINIVLRRDGDEHQSVDRVVAMVNETKADLYISLHTDGTLPSKERKAIAGDPKAIDLYIPSDQHADNYAGSQLLATMIAGAMKQGGQTMRGIKTRAKVRLIIDRIQVPGVLVEAGSISNPDMLATLKDDVYQKKLANLILNGINNYLSKLQGAQRKPVIEDTVIIKEKNSSSAVVIKMGDTSIIQQLRPWTAQTIPLIIIDGVRTDYGAMNGLDMGTVAEVRVIKKGAMELYGEDARNGVIVITTKSYVAKIKRNAYPSNKFADTVAWLKGSDTNRSANRPLYIVNGVKRKNTFSLDSIIVGTIKSVAVFKDARATEKYGEDAGNGVVEIKTNDQGAPPPNVTNGTIPAGTTYTWPAPSKTGEPAFPLRYIVQGYPIDVVIQRRSDVPDFPGGQSAWNRFLEQNIDRNLVERKGGAPGKYTVIVSFIVSEKGEISNVKADNDQGYGTKEEAERLINIGPNWKPAIKDGKAVSSVYKQSITFYVADVKAKLDAIKDSINYYGLGKIKRPLLTLL